MKDRIFVSSGIACCVIFSQIEMKWWWSVIKNKIYMDKRRHGLTRGEEGLKNLVIGSELHPTDWTDFRHSLSGCLDSRKRCGRLAVPEVGSRNNRQLSCSPLSLKLCRWQVSQRGMQPLVHVDLLQKAPDVGSRIRQIAILMQVHLFLFERAHEPLNKGIFRWRAFGGHTDLHLCPLQHLHIAMRGVLYPLIRMVDLGMSLSQSAL